MLEALASVNMRESVSPGHIIAIARIIARLSVGTSMK
jgi:hypothetical protein